MRLYRMAVTALQERAGWHHIVHTPVIVDRGAVEFLRVAVFASTFQARLSHPSLQA